MITLYKVTGTHTKYDHSLKGGNLRIYKRTHN